MRDTRVRFGHMRHHVAGIAAASVLLLSACGASAEPQTTETDAAPPATTEAAAGSPAATPEAAASSPAEEASGATGAQTKVAIGTEFTDDETGDTITIVSATRNNPTEYYEASGNPNGEMIYLEVSVVPGQDYGGTISSSDFYLESGGEESNYAATASKELEASGLTYFDMAPRRDGEHTGFIPIYVPTTADTLKGSYLRPEAKVIGQDRTVPEFRADFEVPAS